MNRRDFYPLEIKSSATLLDELITAELKVEHKSSDENRSRYQRLSVIIRERIGDTKHDQELDDLISELRYVVRACWQEQEKVMRYRDLIANTYDIAWNDIAKDCAEAAVRAQEYNARRNKLIRSIDSLLGEEKETVLEKTYG